MEDHNGKHIFGVAKVGEKGQIVIPRDARKLYGINPGDSVMLIGDENGMALIKTELFSQIVGQVVGDLTQI